ncbi:endonuclease/exonuclease/phosphatase family protein [Ktedonospora formicarum]|uniref:Endonuclease/exonuclease/phosphatase domain-containing protein n=1 Tax=Ktedonospora formicarum TaxID=2778364 RepID=A0A8J3HUI2_9CHLR|nr:endonuclease/exonuclease/phosphatase family protein [Ktedonospora formicarum]GHO43521.1 hypothetical protein KSX_16840 [Ktedonospora formicarum]
MTCVVSFNILAGGYNVRERNSKRTQQICSILRSVDPDIVGLVEATHPHIHEKSRVIDEIAAEMGMQLIMGGDATHAGDYQLALLTRLPVLETRIHPRPGILNKPLLEVIVKEKNGERLTVFVTHLWAAFSKGRGGNGLRMREVREILHILAPLRAEGKPHLLMGDFNSLAPGEALRASELIRIIAQQDQARLASGDDKWVSDGIPSLNNVVPPPLRFLNPLLRAIPRSQILCNLFDLAASLYAPRGSVRLVQEAGYVDCFRKWAPTDPGFTCPAAAPAGRIDYIFSEPGLAKRLERCLPLVMGNGIPASQASDHLAMTATFANEITGTRKQRETNAVTSQS